MLNNVCLIPGLTINIVLVSHLKKSGFADQFVGDNIHSFLMEYSILRLGLLMEFMNQTLIILQIIIQFIMQEPK